METSVFDLSLEVNDKELLQLVKSIQDGNQLDINIPLLRDKLKRLIKWIKNSKNNSSVINDDEAFDVCMMPIYEAAMNFDFSHKTKFSTYVFYYIKSALYSEIDERNGINVPDRIKRFTPKILQVINEYSQENDGDEPSDEEIQEILLNDEIDISLDDIELCRSMYFLNVPTQIQNDEDNERSILDTVAGSTTDNYTDKTIEEILDITDVSEREKRVFLLKEEKGMKVKEIADVEGVSLSVITRIITRVKAKIWNKKKELGLD